MRQREKLFGYSRPRPLDRNAKARIMHWARCLAGSTSFKFMALMLRGVL